MSIQAQIPSPSKVKSMRAPVLQSELSIFHWRVRLVGKKTMLPDFSGSMLRGAFGHALKQVSCGTGVCAACGAKAECVYYSIFEARNMTEKAQSKGLVFQTRPYIIMEQARKLFPENDSKSTMFLDFSFLLMGYELDVFIPLLDAFQYMARQGLGKYRSIFELDSVYDINADKLLWAKQGLQNMPQYALVQEKIKPINSADNFILLELATPLRLVRKGQPCRKFDIDFFWQQITRRYEILHDLYGVLRMSDLQVRKPECLFADTRYVEWERYSDRQKKRHTQSGLLGRVCLTDFGPREWEFLQVMSFLHAGKNTSFGLGNFRLSGVSDVDSYYNSNQKS